MNRNRVLAVVACLLALLVGLVVGRGVPAQLWPSIFGQSESPSTTEVVEAVRTEEQVVLVSLGVQGIASDQVQRSIRGIEIPGTERVQFVQYSYRAKLGLDGSRVGITQKGEKSYEITLPEFIFIGHDEAKFSTAVEKNGVLSWSTPKIDTAKIVEDVLDGQAKQEQVEANRELLEQQAETFYSGIVKAVEPEAQITFRHSHS
ncbi:hypothetical protein [Luteococcus sp. OSA5]|uniref:hypothetical protein n=1 Tax=Luteococcus sp. OSA5 TaxID=3401630 RepID=UPI003B42A137